MNGLEFFAGVAVATFAASSLFFYKFWKTSKDRFFLFFAWAFAILAIDRIVPFYVAGAQDSIWTNRTESSSWVFLIRLLASVLILLAVLDKNRTKSS